MAPIGLARAPVDNARPDGQPQPDRTLHAHTKGASPLGFGHPLVSEILQGGAGNEQDESADDIDGAPTRKARQANRSPTIGGIRRIMRRAHTPEGLVVHYETRLRTFLGVDGGDDNGDNEWQVIDKDDATFSPFGSDAVFDEGDMVVLGRALLRTQDAGCRRSPEIAAGIKSSLVAEWPIKDSFARLIVHTMCRYYGLVSFSDTLDGGKNVVHICHPRFFNAAEEVNVPKDSFHDFLYSEQG
ncbi:hypothetical protein IWQ57_002350 [Coemansia nantahalensis]|uniref:Uncharacterized protein n=1 Tax=Coemansia nantahalensis TaxID=2789366 RepID=A0ACC1K0F0_9FUNG|nr:hypothetical protein IWQ57_002350 [Coemansia nantahalensis]